MVFSLWRAEIDLNVTFYLKARSTASGSTYKCSQIWKWVKSVQDRNLFGSGRQHGWSLRAGSCLHWDSVVPSEELLSGGLVLRSPQHFFGIVLALSFKLVQDLTLLMHLQTWNMHKKLFWSVFINRYFCLFIFQKHQWVFWLQLMWKMHKKNLHEGHPVIKR